jgi:transposase
MFLYYFAELLDQERPEWREDTIILMDNASYNKSEETIEFIKRFGIPVIFSAAYAYDASPIERYFGYLKQGEIMQSNKPSGKT